MLEQHSWLEWPTLRGLVPVDYRVNNEPGVDELSAMIAQAERMAPHPLVERVLQNLRHLRSVRLEEGTARDVNLARSFTLMAASPWFEFDRAGRARLNPDCLTATWHSL